MYFPGGIVLRRNCSQKIPFEPHTDSHRMIAESRAALALWTLIAALVAAPVTLRAQTAQFSGVILTLGGGFSGPNGIAVDGSGNVYVSD